MFESNPRDCNFYFNRMRFREAWSKFQTEENNRAHNNGNLLLNVKSRETTKLLRITPSISVHSFRAHFTTACVIIWEMEIMKIGTGV